MELRKSYEATEQKFERQNRPRTAKGRRRKALEIPILQEAAKPLLKELVNFLDGKLSQKPAPKPEWLDAFINHAKLPIEELALTILAPILDRVHRGWGDGPDKKKGKKKGPDKRSRAMLLEKELGETLRDHLARRQALININSRIQDLVKIKTRAAKKEWRDLERLLKEKPRH